jgi:hypothetical protein
LSSAPHDLIVTFDGHAIGGVDDLVRHLDTGRQ